MRMMLFLLLLPLLLYRPSADACQPPMPSFQHSAPSVSVPASPVYIPSSGLGALGSNSVTGLQPQPIPPVSSSELNQNQQLEMIDAKDEMSQVTPYPGYIPPPPVYPTLVDELNQDNQQDQQSIDSNRVAQQATLTMQSGTPIQVPVNPGQGIPIPGGESSPAGCPTELTSLAAFLQCVKRYSSMTSDDRATNCTFDSDSSCRFQSASTPLSVGSLPTQDHYRSFAALAHRPEVFQPKRNFVFFVEHRGARPEDEFLLTTTVTCQKGNGVLKFDYWIVGNPAEMTLRVCTQDHFARSCTQSIAYGGASQVSVEVVHPNSTVFDVEIVASNVVTPTVVAYDNIVYEAQLCEQNIVQKDDVNVERSSDAVDSFFDEHVGEADEEPSESDDGRSLSIPSRPEFPPIANNFEGEGSDDEVDDQEEMPPKRSAPSATLCDLLDCEFNEDLCAYSNYANSSMSLAAWQVGNHRVGNPHTGVRDSSGGFLYVGTDSGSQKIVNYILESANITVDEDFQLSVDVYRRSNDITLQVCIDTPFYCPYSVSPFQKDVYWKEGETFLIPRGTTKIYLRAIQWRRFKWLAIDNLKVISNKC